MHPILFEGQSFTLHSYGTFFLLAWALGGVLFLREVKRRGWPVDQMLFVMVGCVLGGLAGSILFTVLFFDWDQIAGQLVRLQFEGKTIVGGIAGGFIGVEIMKKIIRYPHSTGDAFAFAIPLGHALGRMGCFLGGCCFGVPTTLPWAVAFPADSLPYMVQIARSQIAPTALTSLAVHPTQLYELIADLLIFFVIWRSRDLFEKRGMLFRLYLALYASYRFFSEFVRGDTLGTFIGIKPVQVLLLIAAVYYGVQVTRAERRRNP